MYFTSNTLRLTKFIFFSVREKACNLSTSKFRPNFQPPNLQAVFFFEDLFLSENTTPCMCETPQIFYVSKAYFCLSSLVILIIPPIVGAILFQAIFDHTEN